MHQSFSFFAKSALFPSFTTEKLCFAESEL